MRRKSSLWILVEDSPAEKQKSSRTQDYSRPFSPGHTPQVSESYLEPCLQEGSSQQTSHGSSISGIFKSSRQSRLHSQSFTPWPLQESMKGLSCYTHGFPQLLHPSGI
ncbi:hypothetical protein ACRRTK_020478 [Alexandromys fortis]